MIYTLDRRLTNQLYTRILLTSETDRLGGPTRDMAYLYLRQVPRNVRAQEVSH